MLKLSSISTGTLKHLLRHQGICFRTGLFVNHIRSPITSVAEGLRLLYADYPIAPADSFADFHICIRAPANIRRYVRRQVYFYVDGKTPFKPLAFQHALPFLEWGLNWCVAAHVYTYLLIHSTVVAKNGRALLLPGQPGSGKSTLCAALIHSGWRLLSDELTMVAPEDITIQPLPRPVSLKNESIDIIRQSIPEAVLSQTSHDTQKGSVAHMKVPTAHIDRAEEVAHPAWIVFPSFQQSAPLSLTPLNKGRAAIKLITHAFNYSVLGAQGFATVTRMIDQSACYEMQHSSLAEAVDALNALVEQTEDRG